MIDTTTNNASSVDPSLSWEWNGTLSKAAQDATLFALYLAMQQSALSEPITFEKTDTNPNPTDTYLTSINFYRNMPLSASPQDWKNVKALTRLVAFNHFSDARLQQVLHPPPLAQVNDSKKLSDDIINNCSLATQKRLTKAYKNTIIEDNTLMSDIIEQSGSIWAA